MRTGGATARRRAPPALLLLAAAARRAAAHGQLTLPTSRTGSNLADAGGCPAFSFSNGSDFCSWMVDGVTIPGEPTLDPAFITTDALRDGSDWTHHNPWRSPGSTPLDVPCGAIGGRDGRELPPTPPTRVAAGGSLDVAFALNANHGGGYSYRLCSAAQPLTESCFQRTVLSAPGASSYIQLGDDPASRRAIPAARTTTGTAPPGSQWTRNPIPDRDNYFAPPLNDSSLRGHGPFKWSVVDQYTVPGHLPSGRYVLSWRWDTEATEQVWANCADILVTDGEGTPAPLVPTPSPPPAPTPEPGPGPGPGPSPSGTCAVPTAAKVDCLRFSQGDCEGAGCCWSPAGQGSKTPWCYYRAGTPPPPPAPAGAPTCAVPDASKDDCERGSEQACEGAGCCWSPAGEGSRTPWCYMKEVPSRA